MTGSDLYQRRGNLLAKPIPLKCLRRHTFARFNKIIIIIIHFYIALF